MIKAADHEHQQSLKQESDRKENENGDLNQKSFSKNGYSTDEILNDIKVSS